MAYFFQSLLSIFYLYQNLKLRPLQNIKADLKKGVLTDVAVPARPFGVAFALAKVNLKGSVSRTIRQTLIQGLIANLAARAHPADVTNAGGFLAKAAAVACWVHTVP